MAKITVVIPVYNTERWLSRCVASVTAWPEPSLEILLIDDGSPDSCPGLCDSWARRDPRIRVIHQENRGLGMARNTGIREARGEFLCFLDSDDTLDAGVLADAMALSRSSGAEIVLYGMTCLDRRGNLLRTCLPTPEKTVYTGPEITRQLLPDLLTGNRGLTASTCCCLFRKDLLVRARWCFPSEREIISEDVYAMLALFGHVSTAAVLTAAPYRYYENTASLSRSYRPDRYDRNARFYRACLDLCTEQGYGPEISNSCAVPYLSNVIAAMKQEISVLGIGALSRLRRLLTEDAFSTALRDAPRHGSRKRRLLLFLMKRRLALPVCCLLALQKTRQ